MRLDDNYYQDVELNGTTIVNGKCPVSCERRWHQIKSSFAGRNVILEVGSDVGFFTKRLAKEFPTSVILSFEKSDKALVQKELLRAEGIKNVLLFNQPFWIGEMERLAQSCEAIDTVTFLSVFHHHEPMESLRMLDLLSRNIPNLITEHPIVNPVETTEFPDRTDDFIQNQYSNFEREIKKRYESVQYLGHTTLQGIEDRKILHSSNRHVLRAGLATTIHKQRVGDRRLVQNRLDYWYGHWTLHRKYEPEDKAYTRPTEGWIPGFSAYDAHQFNLIYPEKKWWQED